MSVFGTFLVVTNLITDFLSFCGDILFNINSLLGFLHHVAVSCVTEVLSSESVGLSDQLHVYPEYIPSPLTLTMKMET